MAFTAYALLPTLAWPQLLACFQASRRRLTSQLRLANVAVSLRRNVGRTNSRSCSRQGVACLAEGQAPGLPTKMRGTQLRDVPGGDRSDEPGRLGEAIEWTRPARLANALA